MNYSENVFNLKSAKPAEYYDFPVNIDINMKVISLRKWQQQCFNKLHDKKNWLINAPTGSGKTVGISSLIYKKLKENPKLRAIIAVPQLIIASGFSESKDIILNDETFEWKIIHNYCEPNIESVTKKLKQFLNRKEYSSYSDRIFLCSQSSLIRTFEAHKSSFEDVLVIIDEAHHIQYSTCEDETEEKLEEFDELITNEISQTFNRLGGLVKHILYNNENRCEIGLATATFFRGDKSSIIPEEYKEQFTRYNYLYPDFLEDCRYLKNISYDFNLYSNKYLESLQDIFKDKVLKTIVYIPPVNSQTSVGSKDLDVFEVYKALSQSNNPQFEERGAITYLKRNDEILKVVNLVKEEYRTEKIDLFRNNTDIDVVIALNMFREGADWAKAEQEIIIGERSSLTMMIQMIGRLLRDVEGKESVYIYQLLNVATDSLEDEDIKEKLNNYLKCIMLSISIEDAINPIALRIKKNKNENVNNEYGELEYVNYFTNAIPDDSKRAELLKDIFELMAVRKVNNEIEGVEEYSLLHSVVKDILESSKYNITENIVEITEEIYDIFKEKSIKYHNKLKLNTGIDVEHIDYEFLEDYSILDFVFGYTSNPMNIGTFREFISIAGSYEFKSFEDAREFVRNLGLKSKTEWREYIKSGNKPKDIPSNPYQFYKDKGWISWGDFLGTDYIANQNRIYKSFEDTREFVRSLGLKSIKEWKEYWKSNKPKDIPSDPYEVYKDKGWISFGDFLGTDYIANQNRIYKSFEDTREFVRSLGLKNQKEWYEYCKSGLRHDDIPSYPYEVYKDKGWISFGDFLGTDYIANQNRIYKSFEDTREFVRSLGLKSKTEWHEYIKSGNKPKDIPSNPYNVYKDKGWISWGDFLGTDNIHTKDFKSFEDTREFVRSLGLKGKEEWFVYWRSNKPKDIPSDPYQVYKDKGWISWTDFLGKNK